MVQATGTVNSFYYEDRRRDEKQRHFAQIASTECEEAKEEPIVEKCTSINQLVLTCENGDIAALVLPSVNYNNARVLEEIFLSKASLVSAFARAIETRRDEL